MDRSTVDRISAARTDLQRICDLLEQSSANFEQYVSVARSIIRQLTRAHFLQSPLLFGEQAWFISKLQQIAYYDADSGAVQDIAEWCVGQWLQILQGDPENLDALINLGHSWLLRAQSSLARIHREEGSSSSGLSSGRPPSAHASYTSNDEARDAARAAAEADARIHTPDYVEARGILLPATEYFSRAVSVAQGNNAISGRLLTLVSPASFNGP
ncbi:MAG: hypothetical protein Q9160_001722 [Pyrenula sp. 1 TL-2023]